MAEHRIVVPGVVGSSPITHPTFFIAIDSAFPMIIANAICHPFLLSGWRFYVLRQHAQNEFMKKDL